MTDRPRTIVAVLVAALLGIPEAARAATFTLTSPAMRAGGTLPPAQVHDRYGCAGSNRIPVLAWGTPPSDTRSLAVTMFDPDANGGRGFWHWAIFDLPPATRGLSGALPAGALVGRNGFGDSGYGGACPPPGPPHHYVLTVWALGEPALPFGTGTRDEAVSAYLATHATAKARMTVTYGR